MPKIKNLFNYFTNIEIVLWSISVILITLSFIIFNNENILTLIASLIGVTSLILNAKGNPIGQILIIFFSLLYGYISFTFSYYGEMITYLGMTAPMAFLALVSWIKNPYEGNRNEIKIERIKTIEFPFIILSAILVTIIFYNILIYFNTANIVFSTLSILTSFIAIYLTYRRSPYFAIAYAANDIVLIILWFLATIVDISYLSVFICFIVFLINDIYGFLNWLKIQKRQESSIKI